jgi:hypothetical protein
VSSKAGRAKALIREFLEQAQRMLRELFGEQQRPGDQTTS